MREIKQKKDRKRIVDKINWLKENFSNQFKPLTATHEKKPVFEFRIGKFRVLCVPQDSTNGNDLGSGKSKYNIFKIDDRGDVFGNTTKTVY